MRKPIEGETIVCPQSVNQTKKHIPEKCWDTTHNGERITHGILAPHTHKRDTWGKGVCDEISAPVVHTPVKKEDPEKAYKPETTAQPKFPGFAFPLGPGQSAKLVSVSCGFEDADGKEIPIEEVYVAYREVCDNKPLPFTDYVNTHYLLKPGEISFADLLEDEDLPLDGCYIVDSDKWEETQLIFSGIIKTTPRRSAKVDLSQYFLYTD